MKRRRSEEEQDDKQQSFDFIQEIRKQTLPSPTADSSATNLLQWVCLLQPTSRELLIQKINKIIKMANTPNILWILIFSFIPQTYFQVCVKVCKTFSRFTTSHLLVEHLFKGGSIGTRFLNNIYRKKQIGDKLRLLHEVEYKLKPNTPDSDDDDSDNEDSDDEKSQRKKDDFIINLLNEDKTIFRNVQVLVLSHKNYVESSRMLHCFDNLTSFEINSVSTTSLQLRWEERHVAQCIQRNCKSLQHLRIADVYIDCFSQLINDNSVCCDFPELKSFGLEDPPVNDTERPVFLELLFQRAPNLTRLVLVNTTTIKRFCQRIYLKTFKCCANLKELVFDGDSTDLPKLFYFSHSYGDLKRMLQNLCVFYFRLGTTSELETDMFSCFARDRFPNLKHLIVDDCSSKLMIRHHLPYSFECELCEIQTIHFIGLYNLLSEKALIMILTWCPMIKRIIFEWKYQFVNTSESFARLQTALQMLQTKSFILEFRPPIQSLEQHEMITNLYVKLLESSLPQIDALFLRDYQIEFRLK